MSETKGNGMLTAIQALELTSPAADEFRGESVLVGDGRPVFGGQLMGQVLMAAAASHEDKVVRSLQIMFPRAGNVAQPLEFSVDTLHSGRTMATVGVAVKQGQRHISRATVLLDTVEEDVIRHQPPLPAVGGPEQAKPSEVMSHHGAEVRMVGDVDLGDPDQVGPPEVAVWVRWPDAPRGDRARNHAISAWYTDNMLIGAAMRPHPGVGWNMAHASLSTGVVTHTLTFHEASDAADWHLLTNEATYTGRGRVYGTGRIFTQDGTLVSSFSQDSMIRARGPQSGVM
ncbi:acyl-CoA thioesterase II [Amycolatopsis sp. GM8]|uniref:acyl-CoA thioesterase n=1 Tax=Amycolatopsis sp. GM8 TaxID=2896530 RepID=UPI001F26E836|nr:acyl-CoA thioesterase domain-containing protein [Amycolatopsis sp. GM8]